MPKAKTAEPRPTAHLEDKVKERVKILRTGRRDKDVGVAKPNRGRYRQTWQYSSNANFKAMNE